MSKFLSVNHVVKENVEMTADGDDKILDCELTTVEMITVRQAGFFLSNLSVSFFNLTVLP